MKQVCDRLLHYYYITRFFRSISVLNATGSFQQRGAHDFDCPLHMVSDHRKRKATPEATREAETQQQEGIFWRLSKELRHSLLRMVRREIRNVRTAARAAKQQPDKYKFQPREETITQQLHAVVDRYAAALELFDQWNSQGIMDERALRVVLLGLMSENEQIAEYVAPPD